jgi:hypothetical protein
LPYLVLTSTNDEWTIEEAGDRDPAGARLGAMLQCARRPRAEPPPAGHPRLVAAQLPRAAATADHRTRAAKDLFMVRPLQAIDAAADG